MWREGDFFISRLLEVVPQVCRANSLHIKSHSDVRLLIHAYTGVEFAAELHDLLTSDMKRNYPALAPLARIVIYDVAPQILQSVGLDRLAGAPEDNA